MEWQFIVALVIALPIILFPVALIWYLNVGGLFAMARDARKKRALDKENGVVAERTAQ